MKIIFRCLMFIIRDESVKFLDFPFLINIKLFFSSLFLFFIFFFLFLRTFLRLSIFSKYQFHADVLFVPCTYTQIQTHSSSILFYHLFWCYFFENIYMCNRVYIIYTSTCEHAPSLSFFPFYIYVRHT